MTTTIGGGALIIGDRMSFKIDQVEVEVVGELRLVVFVRQWNGVGGEVKRNYADSIHRSAAGAELRLELRNRKETRFQSPIRLATILYYSSKREVPDPQLVRSPGYYAVVRHARHNSHFVHYCECGKDSFASWVVQTSH